MQQQRGFTLIELIIVIVILGILAVTAAPKFLDIQGDAKASVVKGMEGAMKSASDIIHAKSLITGASGSETGTLTLKGSATVTTDYGYARHDWGQAWVEMLDGTFIEVNNNNACSSDFCVDESYNITTNISPTVLTHSDRALIVFPKGTTRAGACYAYYVHDESASAEGAIPTIGSVTTGC